MSKPQFMDEAAELEDKGRGRNKMGMGMGMVAPAPAQGENGHGARPICPSAGPGGWRARAA
jgi:hypothetical protein